MALPLITAPEFFTNVPSTGQEICYRPFLVKEEKVLYIAMEGGDEKEILNAVIKILESCISTPGVDVKKFAPFDLEYLFLMVRSKSVGETINLHLKHSDETSLCEHVHKEVINIDSIQLDRSKEISNKVMITDNVGVVFRYPSLLDMTKIKKNNTELEQVFDMISNCTVSVFDEKEVYDSFTKQELIDFIGNLSKDQFEKVMSFFTGAPSLRHVVEWTCPKCGVSEKVVLEGLQSFFG